jgi:hypothetical protein
VAETVIIPITGRRLSGKDTVAKLAIEKFSCTGSVALSDWFKVLLAKHFSLPLENFYSAKKDEPFDRPIVIRHGDISRLLSATSQSASVFVDVRYQKLSISRWIGREVKSIRELMIWWANEVVSGSKELGEGLHNAITAGAIKKIVDAENKRDPKKDSPNVILVTDVRRHGQSVWFSDKPDSYPETEPRFKHVYPIKIERPLGTLDQDPSEMAVDEFPDNYFFATIVNDEDISALEQKVQEVLGKIRADLRTKFRTKQTTLTP